MRPDYPPPPARTLLGLLARCAWLHERARQFEAEAREHERKNTQGRTP